MIKNITVYTTKEIKKWDREILEAKFFSLQFITSQVINYANNGDKLIKEILGE